MDILIVTGQSGSGKSTALRALEDQGFYCADNVPTRLIEQLVDLVDKAGGGPRLAVGMDVRERGFLQELPDLIARLRRGPRPVRVVFLEAREEVMVRRYSETRRRHPLDSGGGLRAAIAEERLLITPLRELADDTLDTSTMSPHALRARVLERLAGTRPEDALRVAVLSFGFKHGIPVEADMVLDVRFLQNPYFLADLRPLTGLDAPVRTYVLAAPEAQIFLEHSLGFLAFLLPQYEKEGKRYFTLGIGCTGGQHRSVSLAVALGAALRAGGRTTDLRHRDLKGGPS